MSRFSIGAALGCVVAFLAVSAGASANEHIVFDDLWGGHGVITDMSNVDFCRMHKIEPGGSRPAEVKVAMGGHQVGKEGDESRPGTLICSPELRIWAHTSGPWDPNLPGWLSIRCPPGERPINGGVGAKVYGHPHVTQVAGGFGSGHDGYWHYKFHNWSGTDVSIQFWGVCVRG